MVTILMIRLLIFQRINRPIPIHPSFHSSILPFIHLSIHPPILPTFYSSNHSFIHLAISNIIMCLLLYPATCNEPLGMQSGSIPDDALSASSSYDDANAGPENARSIIHSYSSEKFDEEENREDEE